MQKYRCTVSSQHIYKLWTAMKVQLNTFSHFVGLLWFLVTKDLQILFLLDSGLPC